MPQYIIEVQIIILKIGQIDTKNESFYAEFFIEASWTDSLTESKYDPSKHFNPNIVINNSIGEPMQEISYNSKKLKPNSFRILERRKVQGYFWQKFDFKYFPMDVQTLNIELSSSSPFQQVQLVESKEKFNFLNPNAFMDTQEWTLHNYINSKESVGKSDISMDQYSSFRISISASRIPSYYFYNAFLLIFLITIIGLTRFTVKCDTPHVRLIIDTSVSLTLITFKWVLTEDIPQISYLTSLDKYVLFSILFLSSQSIYDSIIGVLTPPNCVKPHGTYDLVAFIISTCVFLAANLILLIWIVFFAIRNRKLLYEQSKLSNNNNSKRLFEMYNKGLKTFGEEEVDEKKRETGLEMNEFYEEEEEENSRDSESIHSQTIQL